MKDSRAQTLATLDAFLDSQRQLIARTQADIQKLTLLREKALKDPVPFVENVDNELDDAAFKISEHETPRIPEGIDWNLYNTFDPTPLSKISIPGPPSLSTATKQISPPTELQTLVHSAVEDILGDFKPYVPPPDTEEEDEEDAEAVNEQRLADLVNVGRKNQVPIIKPPAASRRRVPSGPNHWNDTDILILESKGSPNGDHNSRTDIVPQVRLRSQRIRRPTLRAEQAYQQPQSTARIRRSSINPLPSPVTDVPNEALSDVTSPDIIAATPPQREEEPTVREDSSRPRRRSVHSETYNKPWSSNEQRLLEKLLEDIPHGEKNRWSKISKAMAGKRTPRQVASRVQKYFEKLKKFGVDPGT
ncbi:hypothetical protein Clacol_008995 [Clathrus columnatus]|uniref:ZZ-type zinc finger-containing protein 3 n=1 Tax=Clathrus columnatus TaxID=1419009 RepID=A0AAV5APW7_9AGAM|nr:hypothetical protein Clacol_008995 [Clathrus columnatus]